MALTLLSISLITRRATRGINLGGSTAPNNSGFCDPFGKSGEAVREMCARRVCGYSDLFPGGRDVHYFAPGVIRATAGTSSAAIFSRYKGKVITERFFGKIIFVSIGRKKIPRLKKLRALRGENIVEWMGKQLLNYQLKNKIIIE